MYKNIIATFPTNCQKKDQKTGFDVSININLQPTRDARNSCPFEIFWVQPSCSMYPNKNMKLVSVLSFNRRTNMFLTLSLFFLGFSTTGIASSLISLISLVLDLSLKILEMYNITVTNIPIRAVTTISRSIFLK